MTAWRASVAVMAGVGPWSSAGQVAVMSSAMVVGGRVRGHGCGHILTGGYADVHGRPWCDPVSQVAAPLPSPTDSGSAAGALPVSKGRGWPPMSRPAKWAKRIMVTAGAACAIPETPCAQASPSASVAVP
jgi:hypothetical protein